MSNSNPTILRLTGRLIDTGGQPLPGIRLAIVDRDHLRDDLLGVGFSDELGEFRISFHNSEYNQELFENEKFPDIYVVLSQYVEGRYLPFAMREFGSLRFDTSRVSLGDISADPEHPEEDAIGLTATPGLEKKVARLDLNDQLMTHCVKEVAPLIAQWTSWALLDNIKIRITAEFGECLTKGLLSGGLELDAASAKTMGQTISMSALAVYEPFGGEILINQPACRQCSLDGMKIILGHELVHAGQFLFFPDALADYRTNLNRLFQSVQVLPDDVQIKDEMFWELIGNSSLQEQMKELEGYAFYIQKDFLEKWYNCAIVIPHQSMITRIIRGVAPLLGIDLETAKEIKGQQYLAGRDSFRQRQQGNQPASFRESE